MPTQKELININLSEKFISKKHLAQIFRTKKLKISGANDHEVLRTISHYLIEELKAYINGVNQVADRYLKKVINLPIVEEYFNLKYEDFEGQKTPERLFSNRYILKLIHEKDKKVSKQDKTLEMVKKILYRKSLHISEKVSQACMVSKRVIMTEDIIKLALQMMDNSAHKN